MKLRRIAVVAFLGVGLLWADAVPACPLCYGGDDPETGRAALWAAGFLVLSVYGVLSAGAWWVWRRLRP
jgi:hypothetical protein